MGRELWSDGKFRVHTITRLVGIEDNPLNLVTKEVNIKEGLGIEYRLDDGHYYVVAFVKPDKDGYCSYNSIGTRIESSCKDWEDIIAFRKALKFAINEIYKSLEDDYE